MLCVPLLNSAISQMEIHSLDETALDIAQEIISSTNVTPENKSSSLQKSDVNPKKTLENELEQKRAESNFSKIFHENKTIIFAGMAASAVALSTVGTVLAFSVNTIGTLIGSSYVSMDYTTASVAYPIMITGVAATFVLREFNQTQANENLEYARNLIQKFNKPATS